MSKSEELFGGKLNLATSVQQFSSEEVLTAIEKGLNHRLSVLQTMPTISDYGYGYKSGQIDAINQILSYLEDAIT